MKQLSDFPEYTKIRETVEKLQAEKQQIAARLDAIRVELSKPVRRIAGQDAWSHALEGEDLSMDVDTGSSLREEFQKLEGRERFINEALSTGVMELDKAHGQASLEICTEARPLFVEQIQKLLKGLKAVCEANAELEALRSSLRAQGIEAGSLASATYDLGGIWNDPYGGKLAGYQKYISENYPEVAALAGQDIALKRRELAAKAESFEGVKL
jgi:hypothetical protein